MAEQGNTWNDKMKTVVLCAALLGAVIAYGEWKGQTKLQVRRNTSSIEKRIEPAISELEKVVPLTTHRIGQLESSISSLQLEIKALTSLQIANEKLQTQRHQEMLDAITTR